MPCCPCWRLASALRLLVGLVGLGAGSQVGGAFSRCRLMAWRQSVRFAVPVVFAVAVPARFFEEFDVDADAGDAARDLRGEISVAQLGKAPYIALLRSYE